ncbi:MAG: type II secretion system protein M [Phenylobacterium sp.]
MTAWWSFRTPRERLMLSALAIVLALFALWYGLYAPLLAMRGEAQARYAKAISEQAQLHATVRQIRTLSAAAKPPSQLAPEEAIRTTASAAGLEVERVEPDPDGGLRVAIAGAPATSLFPWLAVLQREHGLAAKTLVVVKGDNGLRLDATLARPGV